MSFFIIFTILIILAVGFGIFKATHDENYIYNKDGTIPDAKSELINHLQSIENSDERKTQIDFSVEHNFINQQEANELY